MEKIANVLPCLMEIQSQLKAPKGQRNIFGNYNYRSCEDILEAVKPLLHKHNCVLTIQDDITQVDERIYIKATATIFHSETGDSISTCAYAREQAQKKGMDEAQVTGAASSYARKYALNGLFCIDDTKDPDTEVYSNSEDKKVSSKNAQTVPERHSNRNNVICPNCGKPVRGQQKRINGGGTVTVSPEDVLKGCGGLCQTAQQPQKRFP